ncbi:ATP-binding protein [Pseudorhodoferax sp. Leaf267]|uniref:sensor histidine kinase n=1 Tax=Pseudorhodoferax sp. Leaf267 TaxID=1736316 RepID=UPI001F46B245|nr:ATP-binding protein [Pseudorhodoferax sp. Leaf267]
MPRPRQRRAGTWLVRGLLAAAWMALAAWGGHALAMRHGLQALQEAAAQRLEITAARLDAQLARFDFLPSLLETSAEVMRHLEAPGDALLGTAVNHYLQSLNAIAGAENLYVVGRDGMTLAAADFASPGTPLGHDLSYRPYVRDALAQGRGRFYGVGVTSARAGYYLSYALPARGQPRGLAAVKVNLADIENEWRQLPGQVLVVDEHRVAILSTRDEWRYRPLEPLQDAARAEAAQAKRYGASELVPLNWRLRNPGDHDASEQRVRVDGLAFAASVRDVNQGRWQLILLDDETALRANARTVAFSAALVAAIVLLLVALLAARRRETRQRLASGVALQAAHDSLERKVLERTDQLRAAQDELVHAGKLAALGQMSAGMVHELNQPLAALQTVSDNADKLIQMNRLDEARDNLARIGRLVGRLKRLSSQLRLFAYKPGGVPGMVQLRRLLAEVLQQLDGRLQEEGIAVDVQVEPEGLAVTGDEARLEQVLANLLGNAIDALRGSTAPRRIEVHATVQDGVARLRIRNNGPQIDHAILTRMFQPFVTSKPAGKGLGLGLMISDHIVREFGGTLRAQNLAPTGAEFVIELPARRDNSRET